MTDTTPLGTFEEQVMLAVLRTGEEAYGMNVRREIERVTGRDVAIGAVYATLDRLEAKGLVSSSRSGSGSASRSRAESATPGVAWTRHRPGAKVAAAETPIISFIPGGSSGSFHALIGT